MKKFISLLCIVGITLFSQSRAPDQINEIGIEDMFGRSLNDHHITLVDWQGHIYNPAMKFYLTPPSGASFPLNVEIAATGTSRLMIAGGSNDANGANRSLVFANATDKQEIILTIGPDRNGQVNGQYDIETYNLSFTFGGSIQQLPIKVIDQDDDLLAKFPHIVDFSPDSKNLPENAYLPVATFDNAAMRTAVETAINDWFYFFEDPGYDEVPVDAELADIPGGPASWNDNRLRIKNKSAYKGFYVFVRTIYGPGVIYSTGYPVLENGVYQTVGGTAVEGNLPRSGIVCIEHKPTDYQARTDLEVPWHLSRHYGQIAQGFNDIYGLTTHEFGHTILFEGRYEKIKEYIASQDKAAFAPELIKYQGTVPIIDENGYHLTDRNSTDRISGQGGDPIFPDRRWMISKLKLKFAEMAGWTLRTDVQPLMSPSILTESNLPNGKEGETYAFTLEATGGVPLYDWKIQAGDLPSGLSLDPFTGEITGTPSITNGKTDYQFTVRLRDYDELADPFDKIFNLKIENEPEPIVTTPAPGPSTNDLSGLYRLKTKFRGENECLEGNEAGSNVQGGNAFMTSCRDVKGQVWKIEAAGGGYYRLKTLFRGDGECLEGNEAGSNIHGGNAFMAPCQNMQGQLWKIVEVGNGYYYLKTKFRGDGECLEGNEAGSNIQGGNAFMAPCANATGQMWKLEKVGEIPTTGETTNPPIAGSGSTPTTGVSRGSGSGPVTFTIEAPKGKTIIFEGKITIEDKNNPNP